MIDNLIIFLKDDQEISDLSLYFVAGLIILLILKSLLKSRIKLIFFDWLISSITFILFVVVIGNVIATKNYSRLWTILFIVAVAFLQKVGPKLVKWYDSKIDRLSEKI